MVWYSCYLLTDLPTYPLTYLQYLTITILMTISFSPERTISIVIKGIVLRFGGSLCYMSWTDEPTSSNYNFIISFLLCELFAVYTLKQKFSNLNPTIIQKTIFILFQKHFTVGISKGSICFLVCWSKTSILSWFSCQCP